MSNPIFLRLRQFRDAGQLDRNPRALIDHALELIVEDVRKVWASSQPLLGLDRLLGRQRLMALARLELANTGLIVAHACDPELRSMPEGVPGLDDPFWEIKPELVFPGERT